MAKERSRTRNTMIALIGPVLFMLLGLGAILYGLGGVIAGAGSESWPETRGEVVESSVKGYRSKKGGKASSMTYLPDVRYEYSVADRMHTGDRIEFGFWFGTKDPAKVRDVLDQFPVDGEVTVHYDPENPEKSVLKPGLNWKVFTIPGIGFFVGAIGSLLTWSTWRRMSSRGVEAE